MAKNKIIIIVVVALLLLSGLLFYWINYAKDEEKSLPRFPTANKTNKSIERLGVQDELENRFTWLHNNIGTMSPDDCHNEEIFVNDANQRRCLESYYRYHLYKEAIVNEDYSNVEKYLKKINDTFFTELFTDFIEKDSKPQEFCKRFKSSKERDYCMAIFSYDPSLCKSRDRNKKVMECLVELDADLKSSEIANLSKKIIEEEEKKYEDDRADRS